MSDKEKKILYFHNPVIHNKEKLIHLIYTRRVQIYDNYMIQIS